MTPSPIDYIRADAMLAAARAARHSRISACDRKRAEWCRKRDAYRKAGGVLRAFDPARVRAARLALVCELRAAAWGLLAEGDAAGALEHWLRALTNEAGITGRKPPRWAP